MTSSYGYDDLNRLTSLMHTKGATLSGNLYAYNNANNISSWTTASDQRAYTYDSLDRLTGTSNFETPTESYSYDAVGNRTASHLSASYSYQPINKLTSSSTASYTYDNNGNLISKTDASGTTTFSFDEENRLTQVIAPSGPTVNYKYDGLGRRIQRTSSAGANERYVYDSADVLLDLNADWSVATTYLSGPGIDNHLRQTSATSGVSYYLNDHLGSTSALTDASGNLVETETYDSFGNSSGSARTRYGYTGRERDPDTGMLYYRARFYDPQVGRFISEDPIGLAGGINSFAYVGNNPVLYRDPSGLCPPQNTYDPRADFRDYAVQLSKDKTKTDCLKLALLVYKAGQVWGGGAIRGLLGGLTEFSAIVPGTLPPSDPNYRVEVYSKDLYYADSFRGSGFLPQFIKSDEPYSNRVRHFVAYMAAGQAAPDFLARRALHNSEGTDDPRNPDVGLGEAAIQIGSHVNNFDSRQTAQAVWHDICGQTSNLNLP